MTTCKRCGGVYPESFFEINYTKGAYTHLRAVCRGCRQTDGDEKKRLNRPQKKAHDAFKNHAARFVKRGEIGNRDELRDAYGWDIQQMTHDIEHAAGNGCPYCRRPFAEMTHGLADITLDIIDPERKPFYTTNVKWSCRTCNTEKQRLTPDEWGERSQSWVLWKARQEVISGNPDAGLGALFEGVAYV